jgi:hypothetical protein
MSSRSVLVQASQAGMTSHQRGNTKQDAQYTHYFTALSSTITIARNRVLHGVISLFA